MKKFWRRIKLWMARKFWQFWLKELERAGRYYTSDLKKWHTHIATHTPLEDDIMAQYEQERYEYWLREKNPKPFKAFKDLPGPQE